MFPISTSNPERPGHSYTPLTHTKCHPAPALLRQPAAGTRSGSGRDSTHPIGCTQNTALKLQERVG